MAFEFDRASGAQLYTLASAPLTAAPITVFMIGATDSSGFRQTFRLYNSGSTEEQWGMGTNGSGLWQFGNGTAAGGFAPAVATTTPTAGVFYGICGIGRANNDKEIVFNGASEGTNTVSVVPSGIDATRVGCEDLGFGATDDVAICECAIWNAALSVAEAISLTAGRLSPLLVRPESLVAWLPLVRDARDLIGGTTWSTTGSPVYVDHPRVFYPRRSRFVIPAAAAAATELNATATGAGQSTTTMYSIRSVTGGSVMGVGTASVSMGVKRSEAATAAGTATATVSMAVKRAIAAQAAGLATTTVALQSSSLKTVAAQATGTSTVTVSMAVKRAVAATASGVGTATAATARLAHRDTTAAGQATVAVGLAVVRALQTQAAGSGSASLTVDVNLGTEVVSGAYSAQHARAYQQVLRAGG